MVPEVQPQRLPPPSHHPEPEELLAYVSGAAEEWLATLVACHLTLCPECREEVAMLDAVGGALLSEVGRDAEAPLVSVPVLRPPRPFGRPLRSDVPHEIARVVPRPLHHYLADDRPRFRFLAPGLSHVPLRLVGGDRPLQLVRFKPGFVVPEHGHGGLEWLLVLSGAIEDRATGQRYGRGDISRRDTQDVHSQAVTRDEPCVAVFANIRPPIPHTLVGKVLARIVGL